MPQDINATDLEQETAATLDGSEQFVMFDNTKGKRATAGDVAKYAVGDKTQLATNDKSSVVGAINEVKGETTDLKEDLSEYVTDGFIVNWDVGNINTSGANVASTTNIRTNDYLSNNILSVSCSSTYLFCIATYYANGTFVSRSGFNYIKYSDFDFDTYKYRIAVKRVDNGTMTLADAKNIIITTSQIDINNMAEAITNCNLLANGINFIWEAGSIDSNGQDTSMAAYCRTKSGIYYHFNKGDVIKNTNALRYLWIHFYNSDGSVHYSSTSIIDSTYTFTSESWIRLNIMITNPYDVDKSVSANANYEITRRIVDMNQKIDNIPAEFADIPMIGGLTVNDLQLIGGTQTYGEFTYCAWCYNTALYDAVDNSINVFYACKTNHTSNDGAWLMKKYHISTDKWDSPVVVAYDAAKCFYGYATAINDNGDYIGLCKDDMLTGNIYICKSTNHGSSWTKNLLSVNGSSITGDCPCSLRKLSTGRWCFFLAIANKFIYSDDDMSTWQSVDLPIGAGASSYEAEIIETKDKLLMIVRLGTGATTRYYPMILQSSNYGNTWSTPQFMYWLDASSAPVSAYYDEESLRIYLFHASRYIINGKVRYNVSELTADDLSNNKGGQTRCIWKAEAEASQVGNMGYGSVVSDGTNLYYFTYKGVNGMDNNPQIYWSKMAINDAVALTN